MPDITVMTSEFSGRSLPLKDVKAQVGPGWGGLIDDLIADLFKLGWDGKVGQVKEKFGGLRFYIGEGSKEIHDRVTAAEDLSYKTCEACGEPGTPGSGKYKWIKTYCDRCRD